MNRSKRRKSLEQYAKNLKGKKQKECFYKFLNENISLKLCNFLKFYKNRRNKMKEKLKKELAKTIK